LKKVSFTSKRLFAFINTRGKSKPNGSPFWRIFSLGTHRLRHARADGKPFGIRQTSRHARTPEAMRTQAEDFFLPREP
jgi:hypothetical protein